MTTIEYKYEWVSRAQRIAHLGIWDQDVTTGKLWWSDETYKILGLEPELIQPDFEIFLQLVHPEDRANIIHQTKLLTDKNQPYSVEYRIIKSDKTEIFVHEEAILERDSNNNPTKITGIIHDITKQHKLMNEKDELIKQLKISLERIRILKDTLPVCANCKKIRDTEGNWHTIESFIEQRAKVKVTHGICPQCANELYSDFFNENK